MEPASTQWLSMQTNCNKPCLALLTPNTRTTSTKVHWHPAWCTPRTSNQMFLTCCRCADKPRTTEAKPRKRVPRSISCLRVLLALRSSARRLSCAPARLSIAMPRAWRRLSSSSGWPFGELTITLITGYGLRFTRRKPTYEDNTINAWARKTLCSHP